MVSVSEAKMIEAIHCFLKTVTFKQDKAAKCHISIILIKPDPNWFLIFLNFTDEHKSSVGGGESSPVSAESLN